MKTFYEIREAYLEDTNNEIRPNWKNETIEREYSICFYKESKYNQAKKYFDNKTTYSDMLLLIKWQFNDNDKVKVAYKELINENNIKPISVECICKKRGIKHMKTELQWNKLGYVLNDNADGECQKINSFSRNYCYRYDESQVHKDEPIAKNIIKNKNKEYRENAKKKKKAEEEFWKMRKCWHTEYQWIFQYGRIPNLNAKWYHGWKLNREYNSIAWGNDYFYCYIDDTHEPSNEEELKQAMKKLNEEYKKQRIV